MRKTILALLLLESVAQASYRVYKLQVTPVDPKGRAGAKQIVLSTLDSRQYEHYHGGYGNLVVELLDTWYCPGDTSGKAFCESPKRGPKRGLASTEPKRSGP